MAQTIPYEQDCFAGGEFDPQVTSRNDLAKYKTACKVLRNFFVSVNGIAHNRVGLQYVAPTYYSTTNQAAVLNVKLIPFQFSTTQTYVLEFGHFYMRVLKNGALVMNGSTPFLIPTVYPSSAVMGIGYTQSADTLFLAHPNYPPQILQRITDTNWNIQNYSYQFGPFLLDNTNTSFTIAPSAYSLPQSDNSLLGVGTSVTLNSSSYVTIDTFTKLMLHMDGVNGGASFPDSETTPKTVTVVGNTITSTNQSRFGGASGYFNTGIDIDAMIMLHLDNNVTDSSASALTVTNHNSVTFSNTIAKFGFSAQFNGSSQWLSAPNSASWTFGSGDFSIDFWAYLTAYNGFLLSTYDGVATIYWYLNVNSSGQIQFVANNGGTPVAEYITASSAIALNSMTHISVVRNGSNFYIFVNGVSQSLTTTTAIGTLGVGTGPLNIGGFSGGQFITGYLDEVRVTKGLARWVANFIPSLTPYSTGDYLSLANSSDFDFSAVDGTVDFWVYPVSLANANGVTILFSSSAAGQPASTIGYILNDGSVRLGVSSVGALTSSPGVISVGQWYHIAFVKYRGVNTIYVNGVAVATDSNAWWVTTTQPFTIGGQILNAYSLVGFMDEFRVSKGIARWTANFTTPGITMFQSGHVGSLWELTQYVPAQSLASYSMTSSSPSTSISCGGTWRLITNGTWTGNIWVEKSLDNGNTWLKLAEFTGANNFNINTFGTEDMSNNAPPFLVRVNSSGFSGTATITLTADPYLQPGIVQITGVQSGNVAYGTVVQPIGINNSPTSNWAEGAWSTYRGWPTVVEFTPDDRLQWANSPYQPQTSWLTKTSNYYSFNVSDPLADNDSININLPSRQINGINGLLPLRAMLALTTSGEWSVESISGVSAPLTPATVFQRVHGYEGSQGVRPVLIGIRGIFVQNLGKIIRDVGYELVYDSFVGADISVFSKHLFYFDTITDMCYCPNPDSLVWIVMASGALRSLTYLREQQVVTFARHDTQGKFMCTCSIADSINNYNVPYFVVNRTNGQYIEYMPKRMLSTLIQDQFFVDSGGVYDALGQTFNNPDFETWTLGPNSAPDGWTSLAGTVAQTSAVAVTSSNLLTNVESGIYSAAVASGTLAQSMQQAYGAVYWHGRSVTLTGWVKCAFTNCASMAIFDGVSTTQSSFHPGDGLWHNLSVTVTINNVATEVTARCLAVGHTAYFDNTTFNSGVSQITGATWLNGQTISILADGNVLAPRVVSGGVINLGANYNKIAYGLPYLCDLQPLNPNVDIPGGTMQGRVIKLGRSIVVTWNSASGYVGSNFNSLQPMAELSGLTALATNDVKCVVTGGYLDDNSVCIRQSDPLPLSVKSIINELQIGGIKPT